MAKAGMTSRGATGEGVGDAAHPSAYGEPVDAIVLAGTHNNPRRLVQGRNKAFLEIDGRALVRHVVDALIGARQIRRIFVVGPAAELERVLADCPDTFCVQQEGKLVSNGWAAVRAVQAACPECSAEDFREQPILLISCDLPLISPGAIDDFVARCAAVDNDAPQTQAMLVGVAEDQALRPFYGDGDGPGVERPLVQMNEGLMRLSNIYISRPYKLTHTEFLQTSFSLRKAKDWHNVIKLAFAVFSQPGGWFAAWMIFRLQLTYLLRQGQGGFYRRLRRGNTFGKIERGVSTVLGGPIRIVESPYGALSLDVDDEEDFALLQKNYARWMTEVLALDEQRQARLEQRQGELRPEGNQQHAEQQTEEKR